MLAACVQCAHKNINVLIILKRLEQKPHLTVVSPSLDWAKIYVPAFSAAELFMNRPAIKFLHGNGQIRPVSLGQAKCILESPVNHHNHWCEKFRDRSERWIYSIYMTKGMRSLFCSDRFKSLVCTVQRYVIWQWGENRFSVPIPLIVL